MLKTEILIFNEQEYIHTWSDSNMMIEREGILYEEAIDPINSGRMYYETEIKIQIPEELEDFFL